MILRAPLPTRTTPMGSIAINGLPLTSTVGFPDLGPDEVAVFDAQTLVIKLPEPVTRANGETANAVIVTTSGLILIDRLNGFGQRCKLDVTVTP